MKENSHSKMENGNFKMNQLKKLQLKLYCELMMTHGRNLKIESDKFSWQVVVLPLLK